MFKQFTTALMIIALLYSQGVAAWMIACDMDNMPEMNTHSVDVDMVQDHSLHANMQHDPTMDMSQDSAKTQSHATQSNQDCCDYSCECEHGTAFSAALFVANPFPDSVITHSNVIIEQFRALDAHTSDLIKPPII